MSALTLLALALLAGSPPAAHAWSFDVLSPPTQCTTFNLNYSGGVEPYSFSFFHLAGWNGDFTTWGTGDTIVEALDADPAQVLLPFRAGSPLVIVGSDANGFGTGGTSEIYTIADNNGGDTSCIVDTNNDTYLELVPAWSEPVQQCGTMTAIFYGVVLPVTIDTIIPSGQSFETDTGTLQYPPIPNGTAPHGWGVIHTWSVPNITEGSTVAFMVSDATGPIFTSGVLYVEAGNSSCLTNSTSTTTTPSTASASASSVPADSSSSSSSSSHVGAIAGGVVGGVGGLLVVIALVMFIMNRYNRRKRLLRRQTIGLVTYAGSQPPRLDASTWPKDNKTGYTDEEF